MSRAIVLRSQVDGSEAIRRLILVQEGRHHLSGVDLDGGVDYEAAQVEPASSPAFSYALYQVYSMVWGQVSGLMACPCAGSCLRSEN